MKYDQRKLSAILERIVRETRQFIDRHSKIVGIISFPILMHGQDTVACITGVRYDGIRIAIYRDDEYVVKYGQDWAYFVIDNKIVYIKTRKPYVNVAK